MSYKTGITPVDTPNAPQPVGPYSQALRAGCFLFVSGQIPLNPQTGELVREPFREAARRAIENLKAIVEAAGHSLGDVVKTTVYITDMSLFTEFNEVYNEFFAPPYPARAVVQVSKLPLGASVEIEAVVYTCGKEK